MRKKIILATVLTSFLALGLLAGCNDKKTEDKSLTVSIAASLKEPMKEIGDKFEKENGVKIQFNVGGSGTLKKQIVDGASVDVFISANTKYAEELVKEDYVKKDDSKKLLNNELVLIGSKDFKGDIKSLNDLKNIDGKIAIGELNTVPAGQYAKQSLEKLGIYDSLKDKLIFAKSVTNVKTYVENGETELGFVYKTDAMNLKSSKIVYTVPNNYHKPIVYELCILKDSKELDLSKKFSDYLKSDESKKIFEKYGFGVN